MSQMDSRVVGVPMKHSLFDGRAVRAPVLRVQYHGRAMLRWGCTFCTKSCPDQGLRTIRMGKNMDQGIPVYKPIRDIPGTTE